jgi:hypothetical protein
LSLLLVLDGDFTSLLMILFVSIVKGIVGFFLVIDLDFLNDEILLLSDAIDISSPSNLSQSEL